MYSHMQSSVITLALIHARPSIFCPTAFAFALANVSSMAPDREEQRQRERESMPRAILCETPQCCLHIHELRTITSQACAPAQTFTQFVCQAQFAQHCDRQTRKYTAALSRALASITQTFWTTMTTHPRASFAVNHTMFCRPVCFNCSNHCATLAQLLRLSACVEERCRTVIITLRCIYVRLFIF